MTFIDGGPLTRDGEWQTFNVMLFTSLTMTSSDKKKMIKARLKLTVIVTIKLLS